MRILFMGTPDFALPTLKALCESEHEVVGVVTKIDTPKGRGHHLTPPPIKVYAIEQNIPVYQPNTLKGEEFAAVLEELDPETCMSEPGTLADFLTWAKDAYPADRRMLVF